MRIKMSSTGQLAIPKAIRTALGLDTGTELDIHLVDGKIVIEPIGLDSLVDALYGKYRGYDFLTELEDDHRQELADERAPRS